MQTPLTRNGAHFHMGHTDSALGIHAPLLSRAEDCVLGDGQNDDEHANSDGHCFELSILIPTASHS